VSSSTRYDGLDVLRAGSILLGVFTHAARAYAAGYERFYPYFDPPGVLPLAVFSDVANWLRMEAFFTLSGFFAHLVMERRGADPFLRDRARRIAGPFLAFLPLLLAADYALRHWSTSAGMTSPLYQGHIRWRPAPLHTWFLEYLFCFCLIAWALARAGVGTERASAQLARALRRPLWLALAGIPLALVLVADHDESYARTFLLQPFALLEFGVYFGFGWLLWGARDALGALKRHGAWLTALSLGVCTWVCASSWEFQPLGRFLVQYTPWPFMLGAIGLALRLPPAQRPRLAFLTQASYWVYLAHLPIVQLQQIAYGRLDAGPWSKFALVTAVTFAVTLVSFACFVRGTALGDWLGARRAPAELPSARRALG
jgi:peptidoglycan/LPS O-acetylase OafA/YrhL